jgi:hypothetical protein
MRNVILVIALVGALGLVAGCSNACNPNPCCEPVYASPCCPAPSQGMGWDNAGGAPAAAPAAAGSCGSCGGGKSCG